MSKGSGRRPPFASNEAQSETLETQAICKLLGGKGNILVMEGELSNHGSHFL